MIKQRLLDKRVFPQETWKLVSLSVLLGIVLLGFIFQSSYRYYQSGKNHYLAARTLLQWIESNRHRFQTSMEPLHYQAGSLLEQVSIKADQHGISQERIQPQGEYQLQVWLHGVSFDDLISWLHALADEGIHLVSIQIDPAVEGGKVNVQCQLTSQHRK